MAKEKAKNDGRSDATINATCTTKIQKYQNQSPNSTSSSDVTPGNGPSPSSTTPSTSDSPSTTTPNETPNDTTQTPK
ncbi:MAG TPA: hypothetical protein VGI91_03535 [Steroidobacteraceae bacterium]